MSNLVTFEQAKKLYDLGFREYTSSAYFVIKSVGMANEIPIGTFLRDTFQAPSLSCALQWIRDEKGISCGVHPYAVYEGDCDFVKWGYRCAAFKGKADFEYINKTTYNTYPEAESALLDEILTYLEQKK